LGVWGLATIFSYRLSFEQYGLKWQAI
jgi:hypothetical protein